MVGSKSELEVQASAVARALEDLSQHRDNVRNQEQYLLDAREGLAKAQEIFEERRQAMFEAFPDLFPGGAGAHPVGGQRLDLASPSSDPEVIEVDDDTPPDPLGRGGDPDSDDVMFVER